MGGGLVIALFVTVVLSALPLKMALFAFAGVVLAVPLLIMKEPKQFWLSVYILVVLLEGPGINIAKYFSSDLFANPEWVITHLGVPPGQAALRVFPSDLLFVGLVIMWLCGVAARKESIYFPKIGYLALAYLAWAAESAFWKAPYLYLSAVEMVQQVKYFVIYLYLANAVDSKKILKRIIQVLMVALLVQLSFTFASKFNPLYKFLSGLYLMPFMELSAYEDPQFRTTRAHGTHGPQITAYYLESIIPFAAVLFLTSGKTKKRRLYLLLFALGTAAVYLVHQRAGVLGMMAGLISVFWLALLRGLLSKRQMLIWIYLFFVLLSASGPLLIPKLYDYMAARPSAVRGRFLSFQDGARLIEENPILGVGLNNSTALKLKFSGDGEPISTHYLVVAAETGLVGFLLYMCFFGFIAAAVWQLSKSRDRDISAAAIAIFGVFASFAVHTSADPMVKISTTMLWFYAGVGMALRRIEESSAESAVKGPQTYKVAPPDKNIIRFAGASPIRSK
jgi:hypothetical protein